jgi:hypothetical protein
MIYHVKVTRVARCTLWEVYNRESRELLAWGDETEVLERRGDAGSWRTRRRTSTFLTEKGITPVFVPDDDPDHQGTVYDKEEEEETVTA